MSYGEQLHGRKQEGKAAETEPRLKELNLNVPKLHVLGYYSDSIPWRGTTDNHSTQAVSPVLLIRHVIYVELCTPRAKLSINA